MSRHLLSYADCVEAGPDNAGGKGWNLARLARYGFHVPDGFVVAASVYRGVIELPTVAPLIEQLSGMDANEVLKPKALALLEDLTDTFLSVVSQSPIYRELAEQISGELLEYDLAGTPVAVRSSATCEDGAAASFAGIHESFLNVVDAVEICQAILKCYASLWSPRAIAYRRQMNISDQSVQAAVLVCRMIENPLAAGVAFTCEPATGRRDVVVLNLARGLGDGVVSGSIVPERVVVRIAANDVRILERPASSILRKEEYLKLARLTWRVYWALGGGQDPQDIELAYDGTTFWILQARPVTRLPRLTFPALADQPVHWSNANFKDSIPHPLSTFTWSMVQWIVGDILFAGQDAAGYSVPSGMHIVHQFVGRAYFDVSAIQWAFYDSLGIPPAEVTRTMGGFQPEIRVPEDNPMRGKVGRRRTMARLRFFRKLWNLPKTAPGRFMDLIQQVRDFRKVDLASMNREELVKELNRWMLVGLWLQPSLQLCAAYYGAWLTQLRALLQTRLGDETDLVVTRLLAASGNVTSAEQGYRLWEIAEVARRSTSDGLLEKCGKYESFPLELKQAFDRYLEEFGHRAVGEMEIANPRWIEDPTYLLEQLERYSEHIASSSPRELAAKVREEAEQQLQGLPLMIRPFVKWMLRQVRSGASLREQAKSAVVASIEPLRKIALQAGRRLTSAGELEHEDDVYHLSLHDLEAYLLSEWDGRGAGRLVSDRKEVLASWQNQSAPPDLITWSANDKPRPVKSVFGKREENEELDQDTWSGTFAAPGVARGTARVILDPRDASKLQSGDILVAPSTDPGWTPLFLRAGAIVMETGGYLSHGAVVAREFGIPAVINIPGILQAIQDGDELLVDANRGLVTRQRDPSKSTNLPDLLQAAEAVSE